MDNTTADYGYDTPRKRKQEHLLMEALKFDEDDLESNRHGRLSANQLRILQEKRAWWRLGMRLCFGIAGALLVFGTPIISLWLFGFAFIPGGLFYLVHAGTYTKD